MGSEHCEQRSEGPSHRATPSTCPSRRGDRVKSRGRKPHGSRGFVAETKRGDLGSVSCGRTIPITPFSGPKERRDLASSSQSKASQSICGRRPLQDGRDEGGPVAFTAKRLDGHLGYQGCLFPHSPTPVHEETPAVSLQGQDLGIPVHAVRTELRAEGLHKGDEAHRCGNSISRDSDCDISRRYVDFGVIPISMSAESPVRNRPSITAGISDQLGEVPVDPDTEADLLGSGNRFSSHDVASPSGEGDKDCQELHLLAEVAACVPPADCRSGGSNECSVSSSLACSALLQEFAELSKQRSETESSMGDQSGVVPSSSCRVSGLGSLFASVERSGHSVESSGSNHHHRCISPRLGSSLQRAQDRGSLVSSGETETHKRAGVDGCFLRPEVFRIRPERFPHSTQVGQHNGNLIHQPTRRMPLLASQPNCRFSMEMGSSEGFDVISRTSAGSGQPGSRHGIQSVSRSHRVEAPSTSLSRSMSDASFPPRSGLVCLEAQPSASTLLCMASRPRSMEDRCLPLLLGQNAGVRIPTCLSTHKSPEQNSVRSGSSLGHSTFLALSAMVSTAPRVSHSGSAVLPCGEERPVSSRVRRGASSLENSQADRLACVRQALITSGLSSEAAAVASAAQRKSTQKQYQSVWKRFSSWCRTKSLNPLSTTVPEVIDYLLYLYQEGMSYKTINVHRSAISSTRQTSDGVQIGQHWMVVNFMRGVFNMRPPRPRYLVTWDVSKVLRFLQTWEPLESLTLRQITLKTLSLMALSSADRCGTLASLSIDLMSVSDVKVCFVPVELTKSDRPARPYREIVFHAYPDHSSICVVRHIKEYLRRSQSPVRSKKFFLSFKNQKPVVSATLARWLKLVMELSGIDTSVFKAHSHRGAAASAALRKGLSLNELLRLADWASARTFQTFYFRPEIESDLGRALISTLSASTLPERTTV